MRHERFSFYDLRKSDRWVSWHRSYTIFCWPKLCLIWKFHLQHFQPLLFLFNLVVVAERPGYWDRNWPWRWLSSASTGNLLFATFEHSFWIDVAAHFRTTNDEGRCVSWFSFIWGSVVVYHKSQIKSHGVYVSARFIFVWKKVHQISHSHIQAAPVYKPWLLNGYG